MIFFPHAKINVGLQVLRKRDDGFHDLSLSFVPLWDLTDILEIVPALDGVDFFEVIDFSEWQGNSRSALSSVDNLVIRARNILREHTNVPPCKIYLHKHIPVGAGLGGGSSDAAYTLRGLNEVFSLGLDKQTLQEMCRELGSDCAFFLEDGARMASGRGDVFTSFPSREFQEYDVIVIKPPFSISTSEAYRNVTPNSDRQPLEEILKLPIEQWRGKVENDFENSLRETYPQISEIKDELYKNGALYASLSGSGSAVYGIFRADTVNYELRTCNGFKSKIVS
ncbi:MAG: 4-(cytidine 5'-diphospho)-2-C-methyl-D-erythritol kinase [Bacteroidales bacterium]|jgi:4-diphosphocytidyl-2-C-methyl-D-erythritol kinase|nr:4-(cytidine 5'-diphospho)-2-C-methyl-D-erythritol kinase [Bacteroidales bacterium]